jgi:hypothetical protein
MSTWILAAYGLVAMQARVQDPPPRLAAFLRAGVGFDSAQMTAVRRGEAVVQVLDTELSRDIAVFGIAAVGMTREEYVLGVLDVGDSTRPATRRHMGIFSNPPTLDDVRDVAITSRDVEGLKTCRPGACVMKLPAAAMARLHEVIDWSAEDAEAQVSALAREALVEYAANYRARGDAALAVYDDRGNVRASEAFASLLAETPRFYEYGAELQRYLSGYPAVALPHAAEVLFWSEDEVPRLRPILSVTHLVAYAPPDHPDLTLVAAKQIYANHYIEAAFDLTCFVVSAADAAGGGYVVVLRRFRFDEMPSGGLLNVRGKAIGSFRRQLLDDLQRFQSR